MQLVLNFEQALIEWSSQPNGAFIQFLGHITCGIAMVIIN